jgi:hypothetical protein
MRRIDTKEKYPIPMLTRKHNKDLASFIVTDLA